jgi:hypothetical protein
MLNTLQPLSKPKPVKAIKAKKRKKKTNRQLLERQADSLVREIVLKRDRFCVCPAPKNGHGNVRIPGHLISRTRKSVRWSLLNTNEQCNSCNYIHEHRPEIYTQWFIRTFGFERYQTLVETGDKSDKLSVEQLQILCNELTAIKSRQEIDKDFKPRFTQEEIIVGDWRKNERKENTMPELSERIDLGHKGAG